MKKHLLATTILATMASAAQTEQSATSSATTPATSSASTAPTLKQGWTAVTLDGKSYEMELVDSYDPATKEPLVLLADPSTGQVVLEEPNAAAPATLGQGTSTGTATGAAATKAANTSPTQTSAVSSGGASGGSSRSAATSSDPTGTGTNGATDPQQAAATTATAQPTAAEVCTSIPSVQTLLPCGSEHTAGSQIVDQQNRPVRWNCMAWWPGYSNPDQMMLTLVTAGLNCVRISFYNASIDQDLAAIDGVVAQAAKVSVRVILNDHANEGDGACVAQQQNGLWFDKGPGSDGTDGCGASGNVTDAKWVSDWQRVATRYAGNQTVIGYDLWNEPIEKSGGSQWGGGGPTDIQAAYTRAGNAIQAIDSDKLIICEGPILWAPLYQQDLTGVASKPVVLNVPNKVVYSTHLYPSDVGAEPVDNGPEYVSQMNTAFGYLITQNIAPVWVGEIGASMDGLAGSDLADETAWAQTIVPYLNGKYPGGLTIPAGGQGLGTDWWALTSCASSCGGPDGALENDMSTLKHGQAAVYSQFVQKPLGGAVAGASTTAYGQQISSVAVTAFATTPTTQQDATQQPTSTDAAPQSGSSAQIDAAAQQATSDAQALVAQATAGIAAQAHAQ